MKNEMSVCFQTISIVNDKIGKQKERKERKIDALVEHDWNRMPWQY
jgi:hypothetical protein